MFVYARCVRNADGCGGRCGASIRKRSKNFSLKTRVALLATYLGSDRPVSSQSSTSHSRIAGHIASPTRNKLFLRLLELFRSNLYIDNSFLSLQIKDLVKLRLTAIVT